jgi:hypothetical protein
MTNLTASQLRRAADIKEQIESLQSQIAQLVGTTDEAVPPRKRRTMSAAGRARIAAAQKARWVKLKNSNSDEKPVKKAIRKMSAVGRAKIAAAAKARWAKAKALGKNSL